MKKNNHKDKILLLAGVALVYIFAFLVAIYIFNLGKKEILLLLTGNYLVDAILSMISILPFIVLYILTIRKYVSMRRFMMLACLCYFIISIFSQLVFPILPFIYSEKWQYIRGSVGSGFLAFIISAISVARLPVPEIKWYHYIGIFSLAVVLLSVPFSLNNNEITWLHFRD